MLIGRAPECDVPIKESFVSSRHCALLWNGTTWVAEDLASRNGTTVNNRIITKQPLKSGDTITIARKVRYVIEFDPAVEAQRFVDISLEEEQRLLGDDRTFGEHGPATKRLEPHDKDVWSEFER
jgi:pSer/pThr/pTyr-binding forkhead associated (FHA) protein